MDRLINRITDPLVRNYRTARHRYLDNFIFIHINKTGGSSIETALKLPLEHKTALEKIAETGRRRWENRFAFTVVRNPWDKVVSHYHYRIQTNQTQPGEKTVAFRDWVRLAYAGRDSFYHDKPKMFMPQSDWISDNDGNVLVDFVCRFENLEHDFAYVCSKLGKSVKLPHLKTSQHDHYSSYYDETTIEIVARWFEKDIERFEYRFAD